jgi:hypothetical protein
VSKHVGSGIETTKGSRLASGWLDLGVRKGCQSQNMCKWYESFPKDLGPIRKEFLRVEDQGKLLKRSCIGKCNDHHHLIMKDGRMKNHDTRIMYALQPLSIVLHMLQSVLIAHMCYRKSSVRFETYIGHEFSVPWHIPTSRPVCYKF